MNAHEAIERYAALFTEISPQVLPSLDHWLTEDVHFEDPFNDVTGIEQVRRVFERMFETCLDIRFDVTGKFVEGDRGCLTWAMHFRPDVPLLRNRQWHIPGCSLLRFADDGRVREHIDHWDSGKYFYARLPLIGAVIRLLQRRVA